MSDETELARLTRELDELKLFVAALHDRIGDVDPMRPIFIAKGTTDAWAEQVMNASDELVDVSQGRKIASAGNQSLIEDPDAFLLVEMPVQGSTRYVKINNTSGQWFRIASSTQDGTNKRWSYTCKKSVKATAGYGGWSDDAVDTANYTVYNGISNPNGTSGTYGNGIAQTNLDSTGFDLVPLGAGAIVHAHAVTVVATGNTEYWIDAVIAVDGACPT